MPRCEAGIEGVGMWLIMIVMMMDMNLISILGVFELNGVHY